MLFALLCFFVGFQALLMLLVYSRILSIREVPLPNDPPPVSIIVAAHNENDNLPALLNALLQQDHPNYEVIIADDRSTDGSSQYLQQMAIAHPRLIHLPIKQTPPGLSPKKHALQQAIQRAQYDVLLFTDADCHPSPQWARSMSCKHSFEKRVVLGVSPYRKLSGLLNAFIRYETLLTAVQYISFARIGWPFMGVGRNLSYSKTLFQAAGGFEGQMQILSGDDDLLVNKISNRTNTAVCISPESLVMSIPKTTWRAWYRQKKRHLQAGKFYSLRNKTLLGFISVAQICIYFLSLVLYMEADKAPIVAGIFIVKLAIQTTILQLAGRKLHIPQPWYTIPLMDFLYTLYQLIVGFASMVSKEIRWK